MRFLVLAFALGACTSHSSGSVDETIGAGCVKNSDCADVCYLGNDFPGGFCSKPCTSSADCPADAVCAQASGGTCMFACPQFDCGKLGVGWHCSDKDLVGGGKAQVCNGD